MTLPLMLCLWGTAFVLTLAVVIGLRLADQALTVIAAASIPASLLMVRLAVRAALAEPASMPAEPVVSPPPTPPPTPRRQSPQVIGGLTDEA